MVPYMLCGTKGGGVGGGWKMGPQSVLGSFKAATGATVAWPPILRSVHESYHSPAFVTFVSVVPFILT